jgi:cholesterol oxidase
VITSAIRVGDTLDGDGDQGRGFYTEDGGNPYLLSWFVEARGIPEALSRSLKVLRLFLKYRIGLSHDADLSKDISYLLGRAEDSMSSFPVLTMGRDYANGKLYLADGMLECDWHIKKSKAYYDRVRRVGKAIATALQAEYMDNPAYGLNFHQVLTAHPLGGAPMGATKGMGVVDPFGQVFDCPGLYVVDGSALPGPVGPNPSLTIAAFSDRCADRIIYEHKGAGP